MAAPLNSPPLDSEDAFLALLDRFFPREDPRLLIGRGDDAAVLAPLGPLAISTDLFVEDVHFRTRYFSPVEIGAKALAVSLSDMAGMGCRPAGFTLGLTVPDRVGRDTVFWEELFRGMADMAKAHDTALAGGDLSRGPCLSLCLTVWGAVESGRWLARGPVSADDELFVVSPRLWAQETGPGLGLGLARAGCELLERHGRVALGSFPAATSAHLWPAPLVEDGLVLAMQPGVRALMDLSDGLARDLDRLLGPDMGADLEIHARDLAPGLHVATRALGWDPIETAFLGGEDYGLLLSAAAGQLDQDSASGLFRIGRVCQNKGVRLNGAAWRGRGFDHFQAMD